eukprot:s2653_g7.t1
MGLELVGVLGQQCMEPEPVQSKYMVYGTFALVIFLLLAMIAISLFAWGKIKALPRDVRRAEEQWADHYEYSGGLCRRVDTVDWLLHEGESFAQRLDDALTARVTVHEEETRENFNTVEETTDCVRYGLMDLAVSCGIMYAQQRSVPTCLCRKGPTMFYGNIDRI